MRYVQTHLVGVVLALKQQQGQPHWYHGWRRNWINWTGFALDKGKLAALLGGVVPFEFLVTKASWNRTAYVPSHCHQSECRGSASLHLSLALFTRAKADAWSKRPWTRPRQKDGCISEQRIIPGGWNSCSILQGELPCYPLWKTQKWH